MPDESRTYAVVQRDGGAYIIQHLLLADAVPGKRLVLAPSRDRIGPRYATVVSVHDMYHEAVDARDRCMDE